MFDPRSYFPLPHEGIFRRLVTFVSGLWMVLTLSGCFQADDLIALDGPWEYREGFQAEWLTNPPHEGWKTANFPIRFKQIDPAYDGYRGWITIRKKLPPRFSEIFRRTGAIAFNSGVISDVSYFYFNGRQFGQLGQADPFQTGSYRTLLNDVPAPLIRAGGENTLMIALYSEGAYAQDLYGLPEIGGATSLYGKYYQGEIVSFLLLSVYFVVGLYHLLLAIRRPKELYNLLFGLHNVVVTVYWIFRTGSREVIFGENVLLRVAVEYCSLFAIAPLLIFFLSQFFYNRFSRLGLVGAAWCLVLGVITSLACALDNYRLADTCLRIWQISALVYFLPVILYFVVRPVLQRNVDAYYLLAGVLFLLGSAVHDILAANGIVNTPHLARYTFVAFILGIAGILANRFVRVQTEVEELNANLERKVEERTRQLQKTLSEVRELKVQQDGDYYLTSLLITPLGGNFARSENVNLDILVRQKKRFKFRRWEAEIGGDLCTAHTIELGGRRYVAFLNGDAMGKSIQGAGGALVLGTVFKSVVTRTQFSSDAQKKAPERWLKDCFIELQHIFVSFDGTMLISAVLGLLDDETGLLYFINAEHPWVVLYRNQKADFIEDSMLLRKIGIEGLAETGQMRIRTFPLLPNDVILIGSDGRDDIQLGIDARGHRIINEDEYLFLKQVERGQGILEEINNAVQSAGELTDDFTMIRIAYKEDGAARDPNVPAAAAELYLKGQDQARSGRWPEAVEALRSAHAAAPAYPDILRDLARALQREKKVAEAAETWVRYVDLNPADTEGLYSAAYACKLAGDYSLAMELSERTRMREPDHINNLVNLTDACRLTGDLKRARKILDEVLERDPENEHARRLNELLATRV